MTYWATLWYAGSVVLQLGFEGQTLNDCRLMQTIMTADIQASYADPEKSQLLATGIFPTNQFEVTCETERLPTDQQYLATE